MGLCGSKPPPPPSPQESATVLKPELDGPRKDTPSKDNFDSTVKSTKQQESKGQTNVPEAELDGSSEDPPPKDIQKTFDSAVQSVKQQESRGQTTVPEVTLEIPAASQEAKVQTIKAPAVEPSDKKPKKHHHHYHHHKGSHRHKHHKHHHSYPTEGQRPPGFGLDGGDELLEHAAAVRRHAHESAASRSKHSKHGHKHHRRHSKKKTAPQKLKLTLKPHADLNFDGVKDNGDSKSEQKIISPPMEAFIDTVSEQRANEAASKSSAAAKKITETIITPELESMSVGETAQYTPGATTSIGSRSLGDNVMTSSAAAAVTTAAASKNEAASSPQIDIKKNDGVHSSQNAIVLKGKVTSPSQTDTKKIDDVDLSQGAVALKGHATSPFQTPTKKNVSSGGNPPHRAPLPIVDPDADDDGVGALVMDVDDAAEGESDSDVSPDRETGQLQTADNNPDEYDGSSYSESSSEEEDED